MINFVKIIIHANCGGTKHEKRKEARSSRLQYQD